jgi:hypothetical protein
LRAVVRQCDFRAKLSVANRAFISRASALSSKKPRRRKRSDAAQDDVEGSKRARASTDAALSEAGEPGLPNTMNSPGFPAGTSYALYTESPQGFGSPFASSEAGSTAAGEQTPISPSLFSAPFSAQKPSSGTSAASVASAAMALCRLSPLVRQPGGATRGSRHVAPIRRWPIMGAAAHGYAISPMVRGKDASHARAAQLSLLSPPPTQRLRMDGARRICAANDARVTQSTSARQRVDSVDAGDGDIMKLGLTLDILDVVRCGGECARSHTQRLSRAPLLTLPPDAPRPLTQRKAKSAPTPTPAAAASGGASASRFTAESTPARRGGSAADDAAKRGAGSRTRAGGAVTSTAPATSERSGLLLKQKASISAVATPHGRASRRGAQLQRAS